MNNNTDSGNLHEREITDLDFSTKSGHILIKLRSPKCRLFSFIDSGSDVSLIKSNIAKKIMREHNLSLYATDITVESVNISPISIDGYINLPLKFGKRLYYHRFYVADNVDFTGALLIGFDFLHKSNAKIECGTINRVILNGKIFKYNLLCPKSNYSSVQSMTSQVDTTKYVTASVKVVGKISIPPNSILPIPVTVNNLPQSNFDILIEDSMSHDNVRIARAICTIKGKKRFVVECANVSVTKLHLIMVM